MKWEVARCPHFPQMPSLWWWKPQNGPHTISCTGTHRANKLVMSTTLWPGRSWWPEAPQRLCSCRADQYTVQPLLHHRLTTVLLITVPLSSVTSVAPRDLWRSILTSTLPQTHDAWSSLPWQNKKRTWGMIGKWKGKAPSPPALCTSWTFLFCFLPFHRLYLNTNLHQQH